MRHLAAFLFFFLDLFLHADGPVSSPLVLDFVSISVAIDISRLNLAPNSGDTLSVRTCLLQQLMTLAACSTKMVDMLSVSTVCLQGLRTLSF